MRWLEGDQFDESFLSVVSGKQERQSWKLYIISINSISAQFFIKWKHKKKSLHIQTTTKTHLFNVEMKNVSWVEIDKKFFIFFFFRIFSFLVHRCCLFIINNLSLLFLFVLLSLMLVIRCLFSWLGSLILACSFPVTLHSFEIRNSLEIDFHLLINNK